MSLLLAIWLIAQVATPAAADSPVAVEVSVTQPGGSDDHMLVIVTLRNQQLAQPLENVHAILAVEGTPSADQAVGTLAPDQLTSAAFNLPRDVNNAYVVVTFQRAGVAQSLARAVPGPSTPPSNPLAQFVPAFIALLGTALGAGAGYFTSMNVQERQHQRTLERDRKKMAEESRRDFWRNSAPAFRAFQNDWAASTSPAALTQYWQRLYGAVGALPQDLEDLYQLTLERLEAASSEDEKKRLAKDFRDAIIAYMRTFLPT